MFKLLRKLITLPFVIVWFFLTILWLLLAAITCWVSPEDVSLEEVITVLYDNLVKKEIIDHWLL